jgi:hypothetical protein
MKTAQLEEEVTEVLGKHVISPAQPSIIRVVVVEV